MSVLIKDMEKPKSCYAEIDGGYEFCPFVNTDDDCVLLLIKGICEGTWEEQYSKCPLGEEPEPCVDAVSREAATAECFKSMVILNPEFGNELSDGEKKFNDGLRKAIEKIRELPPVTPKQKTGKWIPHKSIFGGLGERVYTCSLCDYNIGFHVENYCPNCGSYNGGDDNG